MEHVPFNPTPEQRANLLRLAAHLDLGVTNLEFDMGRFQDNQTDAEGMAHECGTVGCAVGHGPSLGIAPIKGEDWPSYSHRAFCPEECHDAWEWMFGGSWISGDNTARGAAARIRCALTKGIPVDAARQMIGLSPLSYTVPEFPEHAPVEAATESA